MKLKTFLLLGICILIPRICYSQNNNALDNFEYFWSEFDKHYAQFQIKGVDWDSVYNVYQPKIDSTTSDTLLFQYLSEIVVFLNDGHVNLYTPLGRVGWDRFSADYYSKKMINPKKYVEFGPSQPHGKIMEYRNILDKNVGLLFLKNFRGPGTDNNNWNDNFLAIDKVLSDLKDKDGIIIDLRSNGGGNSANSWLVASRFADKERLCYTFYSKNGEGNDDFTDWREIYIAPGGEFQYTKPVIVLTSKFTFSSAEVFVMCMKAFPHVTVVGDITAGGVGNPIMRKMPNGWDFRLSTKVAATKEKEIIEGKGVQPDLLIVNTKQDQESGRDKILEKAIAIIEEQSRETTAHNNGYSK